MTSPPTSVSTLPPEVLQDIFLSQQASNLVTHSCVMSRSCRPFCWLVVAHVSRQWRATALACPPLWSRFIISTDPNWTAELLRRSHNAPLSVMLRLSAERMDAQLHSFAMVLRHLSRIEDLHISRQGHFSLSPSVVSMLSGRAPRLRSFSSCGSLLAPSVLSEATDIPDLLDSENSPRLESLTLSGPFDDGSRFTGPCASTLRHLKVVMITEWFCRWPSTPALLGILGAAPLLETLIFERRELDITSMRYAPMQHATLPHLHSLTLATADDEVVAILDHLDLPAIRHFEVPTALTRVTAVAFATALQRNFATFGAIHELNIEGSPSTRAQSLQLSGSSTDPAAPGEDARRRLLSLHIQRCDDAMQVAGEICRRLVLHEVRSLQVECDVISAPVWAAMLGHMRNLYELTVVGTYPAVNLPCALYPGLLVRGSGNMRNSSVGDAPRELSAIPLPALRSLCLRRACLDQKDNYDTGILGACSEGLRAALRARSEAGAPLQELVLDDCCNINKTTLSALRSVMEETGGRLFSAACGGGVMNTWDNWDTTS